MIYKDDIKRFATLIIECLRQEFEVVHVSKNLINTIYVENTIDGYKIHIPAEIYNKALYKKEKVIIYKHTGSYAASVDEKGGYSKLHKNYIDRCIEKAYLMWREEMKIKCEEIKKEIRK